MIPEPSEAFWSQLTALVRGAEIKIDRPKGSRHPRYPDAVYALDYGYLKGTHGGDGDGIDVWIGSKGAEAVTGIVCTVDAGNRDAEIKVLLGCTAADVSYIVTFHSRGDQEALVILRPQ